MIIQQNKILTINDRRTSMRLCSQEWEALKDICTRERIHRNHIIEILDKMENTNLGLTSLTRLFLLMYYKSIVNSSLQHCDNPQNFHLQIIENIKLAGINVTK